MDWNSRYIEELVARALAEDVGAGDVSVAATVSAEAMAGARIVAEQNLVCAGLPLVEKIFVSLDPGMRFAMRAEDGQEVRKGADVLHLSGKAGAILTAERTALNFLGRLSGIATTTQRFVKEIAGTRARMRDTRETTPGLRLLEKYAVKMGRGTNHRFGLFDAIVLRTNDIALAGGVRAALDQAHAFASSRMKPQAMTAYESVGTPPSEAEANSLPVQIEVRNEHELREALSAGAESVLLNNMSPVETGRCVGIVREIRRDCVVEISGGITLENVRAYAETGADYLSSRVLTGSAPNADFCLLVDNLR